MDGFKLHLQKNFSETNFILHCKWGFDGASGQSTYKQRFQYSNPEVSNSHLLSTTLVPLQLSSGSTVLWRNPTPSSVRYCRPIHLQYKKEDTDLSISEKTI